MALDGAMSALTSIHAQAAMLGSSAAIAVGGSASAFGAEAFGARVGMAQDAFLRGFAQDIADGVYRTTARGGRWQTRETARGAMDRRIALYAQRVRGTANAAWLGGLPEGTRCRWVLGVSEHCDDCLHEAAQGWRDKALLKRVPGDGSTECITNCRCHLVADVIGFGTAKGF